MYRKDFSEFRNSTTYIPYVTFSDGVLTLGKTFDLRKENDDNENILQKLSLDGFTRAFVTESLWNQYGGRKRMWLRITSKCLTGL